MGPKTAALQAIHREASEVEELLRSHVPTLALEGRPFLVIGTDLEGLPEARLHGEETLCRLLDAQWLRFQTTVAPSSTFRLGGRLIACCAAEDDLGAQFAAARDAVAAELSQPIDGVPPHVPIGCVVWREVVQDHRAAAGAVDRIVDIGEFSRSRDYRSLARLLAGVGTFDEVARRSAAALTAGDGLAAVEIRLDSVDVHVVSGSPPSGSSGGEILIPAAQNAVLRWWFGEEDDRGATEHILRSMSLAIQAAIDRVDAAASALHAAEHDDLTGLLNRAGLRRRIQATNRPFVVGVVDLDRLKAINDARGHAAGDRAICRVARSLAGGRTTDLAARWGGEEFVVILFDSSPSDAAAWLRGRLDELAADDSVDAVSFSAGTAPCNSFAAFDTAFAAADALAYRAKADGRRRVYHTADGE